MKTNFLNVCVILSLLFFSACIKLPPSAEVPVDVSKMTINNVVIPVNFNFATSRNIKITLTAPSVLKGAVFQLQTIKKGLVMNTFGQGAFDAEGTFTGLYPVNSNIDTIRILSGYLGLINQIDIPLVASNATFDYRTLYNVTKSAKIPSQNLPKAASGLPFTYMASFDGDGVPSNLIAADVFDSNFLSDINAALPEFKPVPINHPEYLDAGKASSLVLTKNAQVWMTFVTEGAGWRNALGFYTDKDPTLKIVFPNASLPGSGGNLHAGSKVYLGTFDAGTTINWFLVANGWNGSGVGAGTGTRYSDASMNAEKDVNLKQHVIMLYDKTRSLTLVGFEDMGRENGSDNDFNDVVFYATSNPVDAVETTHLTPLKAAVDSDGDGIIDALDAYPNDPNKALNNYLPTGSVAFEDLWPRLGDYDFNDLVVNYNINQIANAKNQITSLEATFTIATYGVFYRNGFAFSLPVSPNNIKSIKNQVLNSNYATISANGTEAGQSKSVIFVIESVNPQFAIGTKIPLIIEFNTPVSTTDLGSEPYDPFLIVNGDRGSEVHLPDFPPTDKGGVYLGQYDDYSNPATGRYYKSKLNLPWALNIFDPFIPSPETVSIDKTYPRFIPWANSGGTIDKDWYKN